MGKLLEIWNNHCGKIAGGMIGLVLGLGVYTLNLSYHVDKLEAISLQMKELTNQKMECDTKIQDLTDKIAKETDFALQYGNSNYLNVFAKKQLLPLTQKLNSTVDNCLPVNKEYSTKLPWLIKEGDLEKRLAYNPFLNFSSKKDL